MSSSLKKKITSAPLEHHKKLFQAYTYRSAAQSPFYATHITHFAYSAYSRTSLIFTAYTCHAHQLSLPSNCIITASEAVSETRAPIAHVLEERHYLLFRAKNSLLNNLSKSFSRRRVRHFATGSTTDIEIVQTIDKKIKLNQGNRKQRRIVARPAG